MPVRIVRRIVQGALLIAFLVILVRAVGPDVPPPHGEPFLRMDPLAALTAVLSPERVALAIFIPALVLLVLSVAFGRFFCGWICPLGTSIDITDRLAFGRLKDRNHLSHPIVKYYVLAVGMGMTLLGLPIIGYLDPIPLITRAWALGILPPVLGLVNRALGTDFGLVVVDNSAAAVASLALLGFVLTLGAISRRYWCRTLCPLGALLALVSRVGLLRRQMNGECTNCGICLRDCKMDAIDHDDYRVTHTPECILCWNCVACTRKCPGTIGLTTSTGRNDFGLKASRRQAFGAVVAVAAGAVAGGVLRKGHARRLAENDRTILPPGAVLRRADGSIDLVSADKVQSLCVRCGMCMRVCPTSAIQPAGLEAGLDRAFTPVIVPAVGGCTRECNACGEVCPTGALSPFTIEEKPQIKLALAHVAAARCLSWQEGEDYVRCLACAAVCPYGAMERWDDDGQERPRVRQDLCVGCGLCENVCPVRPERAIWVGHTMNG